MTTRRLYFDDAMLQTFEARVMGVTPLNAGRVSIELDETGFYPEGGGQPADHGMLNQWSVLDVQLRDDRVVHEVDVTGDDEGPEVGMRVVAAIDWQRRFDHMQQHTGQHLLSALLLQYFGLETLAFHLGASSSTIDLPGEPLGRETIVAIEERIAETVRAALPVVATFHGVDEEVRGLRKAPQVEGTFRVVSIGDLDLSPCGGTHVVNTAHLETAILGRVDRVKPGVSRLEFQFGGRARRSHRSRLELLASLRPLLQVEEERMVDATERLVGRVKEGERRLRALSRELIPHRAEELLAQADRIEGVALLAISVETEERDDLPALGRALSLHERVAALLVAEGGSGQVVAVARGVPFDARELLLHALGPDGNGGGSDRVAQGGYRGEDRSALLDRARAFVVTHLGNES